MAFTNPTVDDFKDYFDRDFPFGEELSQVRDKDVQRALDDTAISFASGLWADQSQYTTGFLLLSAHHLVMNLRASSQGTAGTFDWLTGSKGVGSVSESYQIPERILANPELAMYSKTNYGAKFLMLILPQLTGQVFTSYADVNP